MFLGCKVRTQFFPGRRETVAVTPAVFPHALIDSNDINNDYEFPTSCFQQFGILVRQLYLQQRRNTVSL